MILPLRNEGVPVRESLGMSKKATYENPDVLKGHTAARQDMGYRNDLRNIEISSWQQ